jgi:hypothetical protein
MGRKLKFILGLGIFTLVFLIIGGYAYLKSREFIQGPQITVTAPENGSALREPLVVIEGIAKNISYISLNGGAIFVDSQGHFSEKLLLLPGYNIMTINAEDRFGKKTEKTLELVYKAPVAVEPLASSTPIQNR